MDTKSRPSIEGAIKPAHPRKISVLVFLLVGPMLVGATAPKTYSLVRRSAIAVATGPSVLPYRAGSPVLQALPDLPAGAEAVVNRFIKSQESRARGTEYKEGRKIVIGDLNNDGSPDVAVLYTLEGAHGGNDYNQYLAVFLSRNGKYVYKARRRIGGRFERNMDLKSIENGRVLFDTMEYLPKDPSCCPSKKGSTQFILAGERLIETKPESSK